MVKRIHKPYRGNLLYVTVTTRKQNHCDEYFGKFTFWPSKRHYDEGDCVGAETYTSIPLGTDKSRLEAEADRFIDKVLLKA